MPRPRKYQYLIDRCVKELRKDGDSAVFYPKDGATAEELMNRLNSVFHRQMPPAPEGLVWSRRVVTKRGKRGVEVFLKEGYEYEYHYETV